jgi:tetratricopeptide (TPR) repeat protein
MSGSWRDLLVFTDDDQTTYGDWFDELRASAQGADAGEMFDEVVQRGVGLHQAGLDQEALDMLAEAELFLGPQNVASEDWPWFFNTRGMALSALGRFAEADAQYEEMRKLAERLSDELRRDDLVATSLQNRGVNALEEGDSERAIPLLARSADMKQKLEDWVSVLDVLTTLAMAVAQSGDIHEALDMLDHALELARTLGQPRREAAVLGNQAALEARLGNPAQAEAKLRAVLRYVRAEGDVLRQMQTMQGLGSSLLEQGQPGQGLRWYRRGERLAEERGAAIMRIRLKRNVATALTHLRRRREASEELQEAVSQAEGAGQRALAAATRADLGALYANSGDAEQAAVQLEKALADFEQIGDSAWQSELKLNLGALAASQGRMEEADELFAEAFRAADADKPTQVAVARRAAELWMLAGGASRTEHWLSRELAAADGWDTPAGFAWRTATAAAMLGQLGPSEHALKLFQDAVRRYEELEDFGQATRVRLDVGKTFSDLGQNEQAVEELRRSLADALELQDRTMQRTALANLGEVLRRLDDLSGAREANEQAIALAEELGDNESLALSLGNLGLVAYASGELNEATDLFRRQLELAEKLKSPGFEASARGGLGSVEQALGHPKRAARLFRRAADLQAGVWPVGQIENLEGLLTCLAQTGQTDKLQEPAQRLIDTAISSELMPKAAEAFARVARVLLNAGDMEEAASLYNAGLRLRASGEARDDEDSTPALLYGLGLMTAHVETDLEPEAREPFYEVFLASLDEYEEGLGSVTRGLLNRVRETFEADGVYDDLRRDVDP